MSADNYKKALDFLFSQLPMFSRVGAPAYKAGLDTSIALDLKFGHPHRKFKSIHVGGTNGKGSTSHFLAAILQSHGYKTGLYTSPHLVDFRERMRIDGKMIPREEVVDFVERWQLTDFDGHPSFFELTMMMAFDWFARESVDYAIIEVGMGGRLDSTNIISPELCVITNISKDHTQFLGDSIPEIASEKAGIIKPGTPVVIGEADSDVRRVFAEKAASEGAPIFFAEDNQRLLSVKVNAGGGWDCEMTEGKVCVPLGGDYQKKNINTVLNAVDALRKVGIIVDDADVLSGLENVETLTGLKGRWTILNQSPVVIADTGHNIAGLTYNVSQLRRLLLQRCAASKNKDAVHPRLRIVIGFVADKDIDNILKILPVDADYYVTNAKIPRALKANMLNDKLAETGIEGRVFDNVDEAYRAALKDATPDDIIFVGGSTFVVADLLESLQKQQ